MISVGRGDHRGLDALAFRWKAVRGALMHPAHLAEGVERDHERDTQSTPKLRCDLTRHEEVRVHQVVASAAGRPVARHPPDELRHVFEQAFLGYGYRGTGRDVDHPEAGTAIHDDWQRWVVAPRVDVDEVALRREMARHLCHVHVLPARVDAAEDCEWRRVFADERDTPRHDAISRTR